MRPFWRQALLALLGGMAAAAHAAGLQLDNAQSAAFRGWFTRIVAEQLQQGPNPRWSQQDCAGLVRFAVAEALKPHDADWRRHNSISARHMPPELALTPAQAAWRQPWVTVKGQRSAFVTAWQLIAANTRPVGRNLNLAQPGDLLFFDQGADQHLMIWMGRFIAYHTGTSSPDDSGLRAVSVEQLMQWKDSRWQPSDDNPNFIGVFRFSFLAR